MEFDIVTTKGGDRGESSLYNGERRRKDDLIFEAVGDLDELNCWAGKIRLWCYERENSRGIIDIYPLTDYLREVQVLIMRISSMIATPVDDPLYKSFKLLTMKDIDKLESFQKDLMTYVNLSPEFIIPGDGGPSSLDFDITRTICRRSERRIVSLIRDQNMVHLFDGQIFINRLSDFLFIAARYYDYT